MGRAGARTVPEDGYGLSDEWMGLNAQPLVWELNQNSAGFAGSGLGM